MNKQGTQGTPNSEKIKEEIKKRKKDLNDLTEFLKGFDPKNLNEPIKAEPFKNLFGEEVKDILEINAKIPRLETRKDAVNKELNELKNLDRKNKEEIDNLKKGIRDYEKKQGTEIKKKERNKKADTLREQIVNSQKKLNTTIKELIKILLAYNILSTKLLAEDSFLKSDLEEIKEITTKTIDYIEKNAKKEGLKTNLALSLGKQLSNMLKEPSATLYVTKRAANEN